MAVLWRCLGLNSYLVWMCFNESPGSSSSMVTEVFPHFLAASGGCVQDKDCTWRVAAGVSILPCDHCLVTSLTVLTLLQPLSSISSIHSLRSPLSQSPAAPLATLLLPHNAQPATARTAAAAPRRSHAPAGSRTGY